MARVLGQVQNKITLNDNLSGGQIVLFYRHPTTEERAAFTNQGFQRVKDELQIRKGEVRMEYGLKILTGFQLGDFLDENKEPFSCDPKDEAYRENWKELIMAGGSDLIELLATLVFDAPCAVGKNQEDTPSGNLPETLPQ